MIVHSRVENRGEGPGGLSRWQRAPFIVHSGVESGEGVYVCHAWPESYVHRPSHLYNAGAEHAGVSPTRHKMFAPSAKHRELFDESHKGRAASY